VPEVELLQQKNEKVLDDRKKTKKKVEKELEGLVEVRISTDNLLWLKTVVIDCCLLP
jgi:hypothetical protein